MAWFRCGVGSDNSIEMTVNNSAYTTSRRFFLKKDVETIAKDFADNVHTQIGENLKLTITPVSGTNEINFIFLKKDGTEVYANINGTQWTSVTSETTLLMSNYADGSCVGLGFQTRTAGVFKCRIEAE